MKEELNELIFKYNTMGKKADETFYYEVVRIAKQYLGLEGFLSDLVFIPTDEHMNPKYEKYTEGFAGLFGQAAYKYDTCELIVYERNVNYNKNMDIKKSRLEGTQSEVALYNLMVIQTLLHEIEHAKQAKMKKYGNDFESKLIRLTDSDIPDTVSSYEYSLTERLAEIKSYEMVLDMYDEIGLFDQKIYDYFSSCYKESILRGYHFEDEEGFLAQEGEGKFVSPTLKYIKLKKGNEFEYRLLTKNMDDEASFYYGLDIPLEDYLEYKNSSLDFRI